MTFHLTCVYIVFSSVLVAEGHLLGNNWLLVILFISCFGFEGRIWVLIASVPDVCIFFTFIYLCHISLSESRTTHNNFIKNCRFFIKCFQEKI